MKVSEYIQLLLAMDQEALVVSEYHSDYEGRYVDGGEPTVLMVRACSYPHGVDAYVKD